MLCSLVVAIWRSEYYHAQKSHPRNYVFTGFALRRVTFLKFTIITIALNVAYVSDVAFCRVTFQASQATVRRRHQVTKSPRETTFSR